MLAILITVLSFCACATTRVDEKTDITLNFVHSEEDICVTLEADEAKRVTAILNGNRYASIWDGVPSCGFNEDISFKVGDRVYAIACDTCNCVQDLGNLRYFDIPEEDMEYIHSLFEKYGGYFPCV
jgi:hypothetical protein